MRTYYLTPVGLDAALTSVSLGTVRALERLGLKTGFVKPLADTLYAGKDAERSRHFAEKLFGIQTPEPMHTDHAEKLLSEGKNVVKAVETTDRNNPWAFTVVNS